MSDAELKTTGLDALLKAFKGDLPKARVGILGDKNSRRTTAGVLRQLRASKIYKSANKEGRRELIADAKMQSTTNSSIGAKHEFGLEGMPKRSFLRVPIIEHFQSYLDAAGGFDKKTINKVIKENSVIIFVKKLGILGEKIVLEAFNTGGFGKWKASNMKYKKNKQTLVETTQLRRSITSDIK